MAITGRQVAAIVDGALAAGKIHPRSRDDWLLKVAAGGRQGAQAITDLLAMVPADPVTRTRWAREHPRAAAAAPAEPSEDEIFARLYPTPEQAAQARRWGPEPDRLAAVETRQGWLTSQAAAPAGPASHETIDHSAVTVPEHEHLHSDHAGGYHNHPHGHTGNADHTPGTSHQHQMAAPGDPAAAGIAAARAARIRTDPADPAAGATDEQLYRTLFGQ